MPDRTEPRLSDKPCHKTGNWRIVWSEKQQDGRWRSRGRSTGTRNRKEARIALQALIEELETQARIEGQPTLADLADEYLRRLIREKGQRAADNQMRSLRAPLAAWGGFAPIELTPARQDAFKDARRAGRYGRGPASDGTIRRELGAVDAVLTWAVKRGRLTPGDRWLIDRPAEGPAREYHLSRAERDDVHQKLLVRGTDDPLVRGILVALWTGCRREAAFDLTWGRVDLETGYLDFRNPALRETRKRRVVVPCPKILWPVLEQHHPLAQDVPDIGRLDEPVAGRGHVAARGQQANRLLRSFGYPDLTMHALRHTFVTLAWQDGQSWETICEAIGDRITTVEGHYRHRNPEHLRAVMGA